MKIDGRQIASEIKENLKSYITPHLAIILVGNDPGSASYVRQKQKVGEEIGVKVELKTPPKDTSSKQWLMDTVNSLNNNPKIHGIIIQRPIPLPIEKGELDKLVVPQKDVDGFHPKSPFTPPIALAVLKILEYIYKIPTHNSKDTSDGVRMHSSEVEESNHNFSKWLSKKSLLIIGRGDTGGKPIADTFKKMNIPYKVAHSKTQNTEELIKKADVIISAVGRPNIIDRSMISKKTILIGVGMHEEKPKHLEGGRMDSFQVEKTILRGDYDEDEVKDVVSLYTPIPGGVGPVNVACLFENLLKATKLQMDK